MFELVKWISEDIMKQGEDQLFIELILSLLHTHFC